MKPNETTSIVKPCLDILDKIGFIVLGGKFGFPEAAKLLAATPVAKGVVWRQNTGAMVSTYKGRKSFTRFGVAGLPDIMGILRDGRMLGIECKKPKGKLSPAQEAFCEVMVQCNGCWIWCTDPGQLLRWKP